MVRRVLPVLTLCLAMTAGAGCDFLKPKVTQTELETWLTDWLKDHDMVAESIHCPGDQPLEQGHTFECTCKVHGTDIPVTVTVTDAEKGMVEWETKYLTVTRDSMEEEIKAKPSLVGHDLQIDCHDKVWVSIPESEWQCDVIDNANGGEKSIATIVFADGEGTHSMTIEPAT